jgi:hypothetical protein
MAYLRLPQELLETWAAARVPGRAWRTLMVLAAHANREGIAWPGSARIGRFAKIDPADARDALGDLAKAGIIKRAGTISTPNGPANRWQIVGLSRDVIASNTQGENTQSTQGETAPGVETPTQGDTQGNTQGDTQGDTQGEYPPQIIGKKIELEKKHGSSIKRIGVRPKSMMPLRSVEVAQKLSYRAGRVPDALTRKQGKEWIVVGLRELSPDFKATGTFDREIGSLLGSDEVKIAARVRAALNAMVNEANRASDEPIHSVIPWITTCIRRSEVHRPTMNGGHHAVV